MDTSLRVTSDGWDVVITIMSDGTTLKLTPPIAAELAHKILAEVQTMHRKPRVEFDG